MMNRTLLTLTAGVFLSFVTLAQDPGFTDPAGAGMGMQSYSRKRGVTHPASVALIQGVYLYGGHQSLYLNQLSRQGVGIGYYLGKTSFATGYSSFGYSDFMQQLVRLTAARQLTNAFSLGVHLNYHRMVIPNYIEESAITADIGFAMNLPERFIVHSILQNPSSSKLNGESIPVIMRTGIIKEFDADFRISAEWEQWNKKEYRLKGGLEKTLLHSLSLRLGIFTKPSCLTFGIGYSWKGIQIDLAFVSHPSLGYSPYESLSYYHTR